ncbi:MAG: ATP-binding protein, partial [Solirubrobacteraceae bacterium]
MKQPITFAYKNLVFGQGSTDAWGVYRLTMRSYPGLSLNGKREILGSLATLAQELEADFSLLRVSRPWTVGDYLRGVQAVADPRHALQEQLGNYLEMHDRMLTGRGSRLPEVYVSVRLSPESAGAPLGAQPLLAGIRRAVGLADPLAIGGRQLESLISEEDKTMRRMTDVLDCDRATSLEIQWLIKRSYSRGVADPVLDARFQPQALIVKDSGPQGGRYEPLRTDLLRLLDCPINVGARSLRVESEHGDSHQAFLYLGALPEEVVFPGRHAELLFAPLEDLTFPVDAALTARHVSNRDAVRLVRRRIIDADYIYAEESHGDHGPSSSAVDRPSLARELEQYLTGGNRPPLLQSTVSFAVGATTEEQLEDRVEQLRREFGAISLHRPLGEQLPSFVGHLPAQRSQVVGYQDYLTVEQFGAMVPIATHAVGSEVGPYIGHTVAGARQPVLFDVSEASRTSRAPTTLLVGTLGSGKTMCMELIMYQALLAGSTVCDIDPKGDHALHLLPGVAERMEVIELSADRRYQGMLDPLRIAPAATCEDLAVNFLLGILPEPVAPEWQTEI